MYNIWIICLEQVILPKQTNKQTKTMKKLHNFNFEKAINIQCLQLSQWAKSGINPNVFKELLDKVSDCNANAFKTQNPFDVVRGESISNILNKIINN